MLSYINKKADTLYFLRTMRHKEFIIEINICIIFVFTLLYYFLLTPEDFNSKNKMNGFIDNLYFSIITHATIGYGDISPKSKFGKLLVIFHTFFMLLANIMLFC